MARGDWHKESDIDLFILGRDGDLEQATYERKLGREIQVFRSISGNDLTKFKNPLLLNILKGDIIKGDVDFLEVRHVKKQNAGAGV